MAILTYELGKSVKGSLMETEDWWYLRYNTETEEFYVEHEWDHANPYKITAGSDRGTERFLVDEWNGVGKDKIPEAMEKLKAKANA